MYSIFQKEGIITLQYLLFRILQLLPSPSNSAKERCELEILRSYITKYESNVDVWGRN